MWAIAGNVTVAGVAGVAMRGEEQLMGLSWMPVKSKGSCSVTDGIRVGGAKGGWSCDRDSLASRRFFKGVKKSVIK